MQDSSEYKMEYTIELMLKEYDRINELWIDENHQVEQRVNFFITLLSAGIGVLVVIPQVTKSSMNDIATPSLGVLIVLLLFGITVLNRLSLRTVQVRAFRQSMNEIIGFFTKFDVELAEYITRQRAIYDVPDRRNLFFRFIQNSFTGGLSDLVIVSNAVICGGITLIALSVTGYGTILITIAAMITVMITERIFRSYSKFLTDKLRPWKFY